MSATTATQRNATSAGPPAFDHTPHPYSGPSAKEVMEKRRQWMNPGLFLYYKKPIMIVEGKMQYLYDETGRRYLDAFAGIVTVSVGHCHPHVTAKAVEQMQTLQHATTIYLHPTIAEYAEMLTAKFPGDLNSVYFVNSGSEANDLALMMARLHTGNMDVIALRNGYHGGVNSSMGLTGHGTWKFPVPQNLGIHHVMNADLYRGPWGADDPAAATKYAHEVEEHIRYATPGKVAAFISESIQGVGGAVVFPDGYLQQVYDAVRRAGGVCIADEVQAGFGRTGSHFWGFEGNDVIPDIVTLAKGIGNGAPLAAVVTTHEIAKTMTERIHFNTYGGNPVSMAMGKAVLEVIDQDRIQENARVVGGQLQAGLHRLADKHDIIGDVRGRGLMLGAELVKDRKSKEPATAECAQVFERCKELDLIIGKGGLFGNTLRIKPPMCISQEDVEFLLGVLDLALSEL
jgi:alanine-glyoxylate transaminase/(R)-3-amino-2-methylpropionate-pyruvate transaminase